MSNTTVNRSESQRGGIFKRIRKRLGAAKEDDTKKRDNKGAEAKTEVDSVIGSPKTERKKSCHVYEGVCLPLSVRTTTLDLIKTLEVRDDDVWILNYPRSGGLWIQEVVSCILHEGDIDVVNNIPITDRLVRLETMDNDKNNKYPSFDNLDNMESPRMIRTSLPYHMMPLKIHSKKPKIIYLARNPKDVVSSCHDFHQRDTSLPNTEWDKYFDDFTKGNVSYGSWFPHLSPWWTEYRTSSNVLFLKYEDMIKDLRSVVIETALFLGNRLDEEDVDAIVTHCTFQNMKNRAEEGNGKMSGYLNKGVVGSWEDKFTISQNKIFDQQCAKYFYGTGLRFDFEYTTPEFYS